MLKKFKYKDITWLDLESPTKEELAQIGEEHQIHPLVIDELVDPSQRTKVDLYNDYLYLVLHFPGVEKDYQEVDFVVGKDFIITAHYEPLNALYDFAKIFEADFEWKKSTEKIHAGHIFFYILRELYSSLESGLNLINDDLKRVEKKVFNGQEREVVKSLAHINHELLDYRWSLRSHRDILNSLELVGSEIFGKKFEYHLKTLVVEEIHLQNTLDNLRETFSDLSETNDSLLAIKTNHTMKVLTVIAFVFLPMTIISQVFGLTFNYLPLANNPLGFYIVLSLMTTGTLALYLVARLKKWF